MTAKTTLTFLLMDGPFENARSTTAMRLIDAAVRRGHDVNVFAYEGAVSLAFAKQTAHANALHGRNAEEENHPLPRKWIAALMAKAAEQGTQLRWVNCGLCVDERGVNEAIPGTSRGGPADFWKMTLASDNTLVIPTK
ncbi:MAG TPA: DsrE family protein [Gammaproteobacteria bacterium]